MRTREIGVRKVLGASVSGHYTAIAKDFIKLVFIAIVIAIPVAWYAMNKWLQDFAYKTNISWTVFIIAGLSHYDCVVDGKFSVNKSGNSKPGEEFENGVAMKM